MHESRHLAVHVARERFGEDAEDRRGRSRDIQHEATAGHHTRRASRNAARLSGKNWRPIWHRTTPNVASANGSVSALASCQSMATSGGVTVRATASMPGLISTPATAPSPDALGGEPRHDAGAARDVDHSLACSETCGPTELLGERRRDGGTKYRS